MKIILQNVRCSYVFLSEPRVGDDGRVGKYSMQIILSKDDDQVKKVKSAIKDVLTSKFGNDAIKTPGKYKLPLRDADAEGKEGDEYKNTFFMNANATRKPGIVNKNSESADVDDIEDYCYSGATFHVSVSIFAFEAKGTRPAGIGVGLNNVMLRRKTPRLDGSVSAVDEFSSLKDTSDDFSDDEF